MEWTVEEAKACIRRNGGMITGKAISINYPGLKVPGNIFSALLVTLYTGTTSHAAGGESSSNAP